MELDVLLENQYRVSVCDLGLSDEELRMCVPLSLQDAASAVAQRCSLRERPIERFHA